MALCFFLIVEEGKVELVATDWLSHSTFVGPSRGTPIIRNLYRRASMHSVAILQATNSEPKVEVSTVAWAFEYHMIGA